MTPDVPALRSHSHRLSSQFARVLAPEDTAGPGPLVGIELEYRVVRDGVPINFRGIIHGLGLGQPHLDPGDLNAYRLASGAVLTADGAEAELAFPPLDAGPGFASEAARRACAGRNHIEALLPHQEIDGYSTHISVELPEAVTDKVARLYTQTFAPALMLLLDGRTSPGLLVRPRPGRLELGGEFAEGTHLMAAVAFAVGSAWAAGVAVAGRRRLPIAQLDGRLLPDDHRYGWFVGRSAFGLDLYAGGRSAVLRLISGGTITAQQHLERCWEVARSALAPCVSQADLEATDSVVAGSLTLPSEGLFERPSLQVTPGEPPPSPFGEATKVRTRPGFQVAPVMLTWDTSVFVAIGESSERRAIINVPRDHLKQYLRRFDAGELDEVLVGYLATKPGGRTLHRRSQTLRPGIYDRLGPRSQLLARERPPMRRGSRPRLARAAVTRLAAVLGTIGAAVR